MQSLRVLYLPTLTKRVRGLHDLFRICLSKILLAPFARQVPITTDSRHSHAIAPNLLDRNFKAATPDAVWLADISYIPTDEGWLYLAAVKDLATMEIVGWSMSERRKSVLCEDALKMAIRYRAGCPWG